MIVSRFTSFTENLVICCCQVTKLFCSWNRSLIALSARSPCYCDSQADVVISVLREVIIKMLCLPETTFPRGSDAESREELAGASLCSGRLSSTRFSVNSSNHSGRSRNNLSVLSRCLYFLRFGFSSGSRDGCFRTLSM